MMDDIIIASCTAPGRGALALLRLDGPGSVALAQKMAKTRVSNAIVSALSHTIVYGLVVDGNACTLDQVLFLIMHAPSTFTGNEIIEITCHNNKFIIEAIIARACELGARLAQPGEFAQRALMNGKIDMLQAEAIHELIMAPSRALVSASLAQLEGSLSHVVEQVEQRLITLGALIEASFEFSEEEHIDLDFDHVVQEHLSDIITFIASISAGQSGVQQLRDGVRIALVGSVNAGKSTLLNTLLGRNRAIVSNIPGTTRDSIEAGVAREGYAWTYIDTAGLRHTVDSIEQEGIVRSRDAAASADLVLFIVDGSKEPSGEVVDECNLFAAQYKDKMMLVLTKADCGVVDAWVPPDLCSNVISVSAHTGAGVEFLQGRIFNYVVAAYESVTAPFVLNQRQLLLINQVGKQLRDVAIQCSGPKPSYELIAAGVHDILALVTELSGRSVSEKVMDKVFSTFCIGK